MPAKDLPTEERFTEVGVGFTARQLYYDIEEALVMHYQITLMDRLRVVQRLFPEHASTYAELIRTWLAGEWIG